MTQRTSDQEALDLLWLLGATPSPQGTRKPSRSKKVAEAWLNSSRPRGKALPIPHHLWTDHGGYVTPLAGHRGAPPTREQCLERAARLSEAAPPRRPPIFGLTHKKEEVDLLEQELRAQLRTEMDDEPSEEEDAAYGGRCSLIARSRGFRTPDHGAAQYEARADKALLLHLGGDGAEKTLEKRKREMKEKQMLARMHESRKMAVSDTENVANRRRAADILSELHKRTIFAELAQKRELGEAKAANEKLKLRSPVQLSLDSPEATLEAMSLPDEAESLGTEPVHKTPSSARASRLQARMTLTPVTAERRTGVLRITVLSAKGLRAADSNGMSDPFCVCELVGKPGTRCHTNVQRRTMSPEWNETFDIKNFTESDDLSFQIFDYDFEKDELLGTALLKGSYIVQQGVVEEDLQLEDAVHSRLLGRRNQNANKGTVSVKVSLLDAEGGVKRADSFTKELRKSFGGRLQEIKQRQLEELDAAMRLKSPSKSPSARSPSFQ